MAARGPNPTLAEVLVQARELAWADRTAAEIRRTDTQQEVLRRLARFRPRFGMMRATPTIEDVLSIPGDEGYDDFASYSGSIRNGMIAP